MKSCDESTRGGSFVDTSVCDTAISFAHHPYSRMTWRV